MTFFTSFIRRISVSSRALVGIIVIAASAVGVVFLVGSATPGDKIILASGFIPAGTVISADSIREGRATNVRRDLILSANDVVGRVVGVDVGEGEFITERMLEVMVESRIEMSVPLGVTPPSGVTRGTSVELWSVDSEGIAPPISIAGHATVLSIDNGGFGGDTILTVRVDSTDVERVLAAIGSTRLMLATASDVR